MRFVLHRIGVNAFAFEFVLLLVAGNPAAAQMVSTPQPDRVSNRALDLAAQGKTAEADKVLQDALAQCQQSGAPAGCVAMLNYTRAYLAQQRGRAGTDEAREYYKRVIAEQPANGAALNNLALIEDSLGNSSEAERLWQSAISNDPQRASHYELLLGDHFLRAKNFVVALQSFGQAAGAAPEADTPRRRIVEVYRQAEAGVNLAALLSLAEQWERLDPANSRSAYELLMIRWTSGSPNPAAADSCLLRWASLMARNNWLDPNSLSGLPDSWDHPGVKVLRAYVQNPAAGTQWGWWRQNADRLAVMLDVAAATGRRLLRDSDNGAQKAETCWQQALHIMPADQLVNGFRAAVDSYLRVSQEVASLYFQQPSIDPYGRKLQDVVRGLYEGKMRAIDLHNWRVTQGIHTTLGLMYTARNVWEALPGTPYYMSALYQLQAVLEDARLREQEEKFFQPLPEIKALLAKGLATQPNRKSDAAQMYLQAAAGYLDSDAIGEAQRMLKEYRALAPENVATADQVEKILAIRGKSGSLLPVALNADQSPWLFRASEPLDESFLKRQRFKIYGDIVNSDASGLIRLTAALEAYRLVVDQQTPLVGSSDLLRWQRVDAALLASVNGQAAPARLAPEVPAVPVVSPAGPVRLTLVGEDNPSTVIITKETLAASQIVRTLGTGKMADVRPYIQLRQDGLLIAPPAANSEAATSIDKIKGMANLPVALKLADKLS
jgi:tetratricopeptide (TPR) repeat protein